MRFDQMQLPAERTTVAPDGSDVRPLLRLEGGSIAHFQIAAGEISQAVVHQTVDEIWYVLSGLGEMWRKDAVAEEIVALCPGLCLTIPYKTQFQFRALGTEPLAIVGVTMPPWPLDREEAIPVSGRWTATLPR